MSNKTNEGQPENWFVKLSADNAELRAEVERLSKVAGGHCTNCDYDGGCSGDTCPECGGMLLSRSALREALLTKKIEQLQKRIDRAIEVSDDGMGGSASDAIQDMLLVLHGEETS